MEENKAFTSSSAVVSEMILNAAQDVRRRSTRPLTTTHFAGRVGGNQEFIADKDFDGHDHILKKVPDAAPLSTFSQSLHLEGFLDPELYRLAAFEGFGTFLIISLFGLISSGLTTLDAPIMAVALYAGLGSFLALSLFTYAMGPVSGGHINPTITMSTFFAGLSTFPRTVLYIAAQSIGGIIAGYWVKLCLGDQYYPKGVIPGCSVDPSQVSAGQQLALEYIVCQALIFIAFGVGLDPRQLEAVGPTLAPVLVGAVLALGSIASVFARPGFFGASFNPARCLGMMTAKGDMQNHWVHWVGPFAATAVHGLVYHMNSPWKKDQPFLKQAMIKVGLSKV